MIEKRAIGTSSLKASALSLGSWNTYSRLSYEAGISLIQRALSLGINTFDVAYYSTTPHTEVLYGRLLEGAKVKRDEIVVIGKVWFYNYPEEALSLQLDRSLARLGTDYVDLVISEHPRDGMSIEELTSEMADLVISGRARTWGVLNWKASDLVKAHAYATSRYLPVPQLAQLKYSVARQNVIDGEEYASALATTGVSLHASDTLEGGILAGKESLDREIGIDIGNIRDEIKARLPKLKNAAASLGVTPAQFSLAFCLANPRTASVLFGATKPGQLEENVKAAELAITHGKEIQELAKELGVDGNQMDPPYKPSPILSAKYVS